MQSQEVKEVTGDSFLTSNLGDREGTEAARTENSVFVILVPVLPNYR